MNLIHRLGIDIGSTTVKIAVIDENNHILFADYERHYANIQETLASLLKKCRELLGELSLCPSITGSGGLTLSGHLQIPFVQEVVSVAASLQDYAPQTDVAIELGGEDAKIIYFTGGIDQRMNGICAGGTGSFIDQMASLLQTDATGLNEYAKNYKAIYPIAARCGVFAKSDIQPLINEGATREDLSASIFQAVVNQTISGLACGKPIRGNVAFLGGPLHFLSELREAFIRTLNLTDEQIIAPDHSHLFAAVGALPFVNVIKTTNQVAAVPIGLFVMLLMAIFNTVIPYLLYTAGLLGVATSVAPIIATLEPVVATVISVAVFSEAFTIWHFCGIVLVLLSILVLNLRGKSREN